MTLHLPVRRILLTTMVAMTGPLLSPAPTGAADTTAHVRVENEHGVYHVRATFTTPEATSTVLAVLTDYEAIPRFVPDMRKSLIRERSADGLVVEQEAVSHFLLFSKRIHLELEVSTQPGRIEFRDRCGRSFSTYQGVWIVTAGAGQSLVSYELVAKPAFDVPGFVLRRLLERDASQLIEQLKAEMSARASSAPGM
jgi:hypothetical protein